MEGFSLSLKEEISNFSVCKDLNKKSGYLHTFLSQVSKNKCYLNTICNNSYYHKNGFVKINLGLDKNDNYIRLHFWGNKTKNINRDIHNHSWDYHSQLIFGRLKLKVFNEVEFKTPFLRHKYEIGNLTTKTIVYKGYRNLKMNQYYNLINSNDYFSESSIIHDIDAIESSLTLVSQSKHKADFSNVYTINKVNFNKSAYNVKRLDPNEMSNLLNKIIISINKKL